MESLTEAELKVLLYPKEMFDRWRMSLRISRDTSAQGTKNTGEKPVEQVPFDPHLHLANGSPVQRMCLTRTDRYVLEMNYTDLGS